MNTIIENKQVKLNLNGGTMNTTKKEVKQVKQLNMIDNKSIVKNKTVKSDNKLNELKKTFLDKYNALGVIYEAKNKKIPFNKVKTDGRAILVYIIKNNDNISLKFKKEVIEKLFKNRILTNTIYESLMKEIYFIEFKNKFNTDDIINIDTIIPPKPIKNRAFIVKSKNSLSLYSYCNKVLEYNKKSGALYLATTFKSTPKSYYDLNKSFNHSTEYDILNKDGLIDLTLICSVTTNQHINFFLDSITELNKFHTYSKGSTKFIRNLTNNLSLKELNKLDKTDDYNKLIEVGKYDTKTKKWTFYYGGVKNGNND